MVTHIPDETMDQLKRLADEAGLALAEFLSAARARDFERGLSDEERRIHQEFLAAIEEGHQDMLAGRVIPYDEHFMETVKQLALERMKAGTPVKDVVKPR